MNPVNKCFDEIEVTSRLLNIIFDMSLGEQLKLLDSLDTSSFRGARKHVRTSLKNHWIVQINPENETKSGNSFINDISRCGVFIEFIGQDEISRGFFAGQKITMKFQIPTSKKIFQIIGKIVRLQDNGIGVKFKRQL